MMTRTLQLGGKRGASLSVLVDESDYDIVAQYSWCLGSHGYACGRVDGEVVLMHRLILGLSDPDIQTDHINRDRLDNRRSNLRLATQQTNKHNVQGRGASQYRGVGWHKASKKWRARAGTHYLGLFSDESEAGRVVATWRQEHWSHAIEVI